MKVLLAVDSSEPSQTAIEAVAARPWPPGSSFEVLTVVEASHQWTTSEVAQAAIQTASQLVERSAQTLRERGMDATAVLLSGDPKRAILDRATKSGADFVVVGSHGATVNRILTGNVAGAIVRHAPCSVAVMRPRREAGSGRKVLLATDGSPFSESAARSIAERPWPAGAEFRVLSVVELVLPTFQALLEPPFIHSEQVEALRAEAMKHAQEAVATGTRILSATQPDTAESISVLVGGPRRVILKEAEAWGADLIVLGSHGRRGVDRFLVGSVSEGVATHAHCSVEVIRARSGG
jgi:nucleotide-binding universal stress UspA family protein